MKECSAIDSNVGVTLISRDTLDSCMRLSEKTIELNICAQISGITPSRILWFGLTQMQEARMGFDAATSLNGRIVLFQFKASDQQSKKTGAKRFLLEHDQLQRLIDKARSKRRKVFYVLPLIGTTQELQRVGGDFLNKTWLLDVARLPTRFPEPTIGVTGRIRASNCHYADVFLQGRSATAIIHSKPVETKLLRIDDVARANFDAPSIGTVHEGYVEYLERPSQDFLAGIKELLHPDLRMAVVYRPGY